MESDISVNKRSNALDQDLNQRNHHQNEDPIVEQKKPMSMPIGPYRLAKKPLMQSIVESKNDEIQEPQFILKSRNCVCIVFSFLSIPLSNR
jgi:hypothetical protein